MGRGYVKHRPERAVDTATEAQVQAMNEKLMAHVRKVAISQITQSIKAGQSPKAKSKLEWEKPQKDSTAIKTKCGRYSCCKITVNGKLHYELWRTVPDGSWRAPINQRLDNFLQAQVLAQQDADKNVGVRIAP